ncbi:MAG: hypothetical protein R6U32_06465 [Candidatus Woesearchaeota archaeon]
MSPKRGQVTIFIIIGIVILVLISLIFFLRGESAEELEEEAERAQELDVSSVRLFTKGCMDQTLEDAFYILGYHGGYIYLPVTNLGLGDYNTSYGYYEGESRLASLDQMKQEIRRYFMFNMGQCTNDFQSFPQYEINESVGTINISFAEDKTLFDISYPLAIREGDSLTEISDFHIEMDVRLRLIHDIAEKFVNSSLKEGPHLVNLDYIRSLKDDGIDVRTISKPDNNIVYIIKDPDSRVKEEAYVFTFASKVSQEYNISTSHLSLRIRDGTTYADFSE